MQHNPDTLITLAEDLKLTPIDYGHYQVVCHFKVTRVMGDFKQDLVSDHLVVVQLSHTLVFGLEKEGHSESDIEKVAFCEAFRRLKTKLIEGTLQEVEPAEEILSYDNDLARLIKDCEPSKIRPSSTFSMNLDNERRQPRRRPPFGFQQ